MKPKKFLYEETQFMGCTYLVELTDIGLELQRSTVCIPFTIGSDIIVKPKPKEWETFFNSVSKLNLKPKKPKDEVLDGFEVKCNVIFEEKSVIGNPHEILLECPPLIPPPSGLLGVPLK